MMLPHIIPYIDRQGVLFIRILCNVLTMTYVFFKYFFRNYQQVSRISIYIYVEIIFTVFLCSQQLKFLL